MTPWWKSGRIVIMPSDEEKRKELIDLIHQGEAKSQKIIKSRGEIVGFGQRIADTGFASVDVLKC